MIRYGIIQLSDLQFGEKHRFGNPSNISELIATDIDYMSEKYQFVPIYLICSGDITERAHATEFIEAEQTLIKLARRLSIDRDSLLCVPGNHDINWKLAEVAEEVGDVNLKYNNYNKFVLNTCNKFSLINNDFYNRYLDHRLGIEFLLLNSCEKEDHNNHYGFVDPRKLVQSIIKKINNFMDDYTKICICHHRIEANRDIKSKTLVENSHEIESILLENGYNIVLSGHLHENRFHSISNNDKSIIYSGSGSTGVDSTQRIDGVQNQYTIHVLDSYNKKLESYWRSFSPTKRTKFGLGAWTEDNSIETNPSIYELPNIINFDAFSANSMEDHSLMLKYRIKRNPFTYSNAEKISTNQIINLFVSSEGRNKGAVRLSGDAIIRGSRGSGKTMLLRYLYVFGNSAFDANFKEKKVSESFPVMVNLSLIHSSEWKSAVNSLIESAERLIYESVLSALEQKNKEINSPEFKNSLFHIKQKLSILTNQEGNIIWKLGVALREYMSKYFTHVLLLIDEVAPVFPKEFFQDYENGFLKWMNSIRNSGPYYTRIAVYPNDISDILNEERFGSVVNLDFNIKNNDDYISYRNYCLTLVDRYLYIVSVDRLSPTKLTSIIEVSDNENDSLEQLIYASDGSSRRFTSLMDKCLTSSRYIRNKNYTKDDVISIIKEFSSNLLSSYDLTDRELALSIAKACKKQVTYRFRLPGLTNFILPLHAKNEELNIIKLAEAGTGRRGTIFEFTYPFCLLMDIQTHFIKDSRKICSSRDRFTGEWITPVTTVTKDQIEFFAKEERTLGEVSDLGEDLIVLMDSSKKEYISDNFDPDLKIGDKVSFIHINDLASDIIKT